MKGRRGNVMFPIPIDAAKHIAEAYGYDQVVIYARRIDDAYSVGGEHMTTYGIDKVHCGVAAKIGRTLQKFMGWTPKTENADGT